ncbi:MAG TPA: hypothetical protein PKD45_10500, partial [Flavobacteriales bacterium]|nr:hypothetical protein [Flavobacteriales bacterium]
VGNDGTTIAANNLPPHNHPFNDRYRDMTYTGAGGLASGSGYPANMTSSLANTADNATTNDPIPVRQASRALVFIQSII